MKHSGGKASLTRRGFLAHATGAGIAALASATARYAAAQSPAVARPNEAAAVPDSSNLFAMDQTASRPVRLSPKPGARASMTAAARDELEHHLRCQCGCTLDVYTCRTTDFSCRVSPAMHADVISLVEGGYTTSEIVDAFVRVYGERALMAPTAEGFNLLGWTAPFLVVAGGAIALVGLMRSWRRPAASLSPPIATPERPLDATDGELARLRAAVRDDT